jgi:hypothetical protein
MLVKRQVKKSLQKSHAERPGEVGTKMSLLRILGRIDVIHPPFFPVILKDAGAFRCWSHSSMKGFKFIFALLKNHVDFRFRECLKFARLHKRG